MLKVLCYVMRMLTAGAAEPEPLCQQRDQGEAHGAHRQEEWNDTQVMYIKKNY